MHMPPLPLSHIGKPRTEALRRALREITVAASAADLLFLEAWESAPISSISATLRASQIRRANPRLAAEIRAELQARSQVGSNGPNEANSG